MDFSIDCLLEKSCFPKRVQCFAYLFVYERGVIVTWGSISATLLRVIESRPHKHRACSRAPTTLLQKEENVGSPRLDIRQHIFSIRAWDPAILHCTCPKNCCSGKFSLINMTVNRLVSQRGDTSCLKKITMQTSSFAILPDEDSKGWIHQDKKWRHLESI